METEFTALKRNHTWRLVPPRSGLNIIDCKWVFKIKRKADGTIDSCFIVLGYRSVLLCLLLWRLLISSPLQMVLHFLPRTLPGIAVLLEAFSTSL
jgi:hypothetical protein